MTNNNNLCPVCGKFEFSEEGSFEICKVCGWWDDLIQKLNPDEDNCSNKMSLNEAKKAYAEGKPIR